MQACLCELIAAEVFLVVFFTSVKEVIFTQLLKIVSIVWDNLVNIVSQI